MISQQCKVRVWQIDEEEKQKEETTTTKKTNTLMNTFWTWISSDRNGLPNYVVHQNVFGTQYCMGLRVRKAIYILENEHS